jgi:hypothetical protein
MVAASADGTTERACYGQASVHFVGNFGPPLAPLTKGSSTIGPGE